MKIVGIVAEYNPFHKGHAYQIHKIKEIFGENTAVVCVMSGDFVQRGEPAIFSKYARAEAAVRCGADLVLELPVAYSIASAERFAEGAVGILGRLGVVEHLVFGSETADTAAIIATAETIGTPMYEEQLRAYLKEGCSYPTARASALREVMGRDIVCSPNDNLGVEYIRAIRRNGFTMTPYALQRIGAMHDAVTTGDMKSGSELRAVLAEKGTLGGLVPEAANLIYLRECAEGRGPVLLQNLEQAILARLRMLCEADFCNLPDASEGLENRLYKACKRESRLTDLYDSVKSKRYAHARIRRMTMCAALGVTQADYQSSHLYGRVLALNEQGARVLSRSGEEGILPIISKPSAARQLSDGTKALFEKTANAHDLYVLGYHNYQYSTGEMDWKTSPIFVR